MQPDFMDIVIFFQWTWDGERWSQMKMIPDQSDFRDIPDTAWFSWQPAHGLSLTRLELPRCGQSEAVGGVLSKLIAMSKFSEWIHALIGGIEMYREMMAAVDEYLKKHYSCEK